MGIETELPSRIRIAMDRRPGEMVLFDYEETLSTPELAKRTVEMVRPFLTPAGLTVTRRGRRIRLHGVCRLGTAASMVMGEMLGHTDAGRMLVRDLFVNAALNGLAAGQDGEKLPSP
jgi:hypothetical protein